VSSVLDFPLQEGRLVEAHNEVENYRDSIMTTAWLIIWTLAWAASVALAKFGPEHLWGSEQPVASWAAVAANLVVGIGWIVAHMRFLRAQDELQRKILLDALAVTLGLGWVGGFAYVVADTAGLIAYDAGIAGLSVFLAAVYVIAVAVGKIRYR
jgi:hypothetical protein